MNRVRAGVGCWLVALAMGGGSYACAEGPAEPLGANLAKAEVDEARASHTVEQGETLQQIASQYFLTLRQLQYFNRIVDPEDISSGDRLAIPPNNYRVPADWEAELAAELADTEVENEALLVEAVEREAYEPVGAEAGKIHVVQADETVQSVAGRYYITERQLRYNNLLAEPNEPVAGEPLAIPEPTLRVPANWQRDLAAGQLPGEGERSHKVARRETLDEIARLYGFTSEQLQQLNRLADPDTLEVGVVLRIPAGGKVVEKPAAERPRSTGLPRRLPADDAQATNIGVYLVVRGDTLSLVAQRHGVEVEQLQYLNNIDNPNLISVGDRLLIPDPAMKIPPPPPASKYTFMWPLDEYEVWSEFGARGGSEHRGLDIAAPEGTPIRASADGEVVFVGERDQYGLMVVIQHVDGVQTLYAHNAENLVRKGQAVLQGQYIATVGTSGNATGAHVHFEYTIDDELADPRDHLETELRGDG